MARLPINRQPLSQSAGLLMQPAVVPRMELPNLRASQRVHRRPYEDFFIRQEPWDIQPIALHPVLPGETLMSMQFQSRVLTDSLKHRLSGWWMEYYVFYVAHDQLALSGVPNEEEATAWAALQAMHLSNTAPSAIQNATRKDNYYKSTTLAGVPDFAFLCTQAVVKWYFRDGGEPIAGYGSYGVRSTANHGDVYKARVRDPMWLESVKIEDVNPTGQGDLPGVEDFQDVFIPSAWSTHYAQWEHMRQVKLIPEEVTFEDYLATFGVQAPEKLQEQKNRPELIRYMRDWQYPSNTVDGATGDVASAVSWAISGRADKARRFDRPGFLLVLSVARPKVFFGNQPHHATMMLNDAYGWLPAVLRDSPMTSLIEYDHDEGPLAGVFNSADDYWVDRRDLFVRGGQFMNFAPADAVTTAPIVDLPKTAGADNDINLWYASQADADALFVGTTPNYIRQDGTVRFNIKSHQHAALDHT